MPYPISKVDDILLSGILDSFLPLMQTAAILAGLLTAVMGIMRALGPRREDGGWALVLIGLLMSGGAFAFPTLFSSLFADEPTTAPSPTAKPSPAPSGEPTRTPEMVREPADLTRLLVLLGVILAVLLTAVLVWVLVVVIQRTRRNVREGRERVKAEVERVQRLTATWQTFHDLHGELLRKITHAETDWDSLFFMPALTDPRVDQTHRMLLAMRNAKTLRDTAGDLPSGLAADADLTTFPYPRAVSDFALAWDVAERHARRVGQKNVPLAERKIIKEIRILLDVAENGAASQTERTLAYRRAQTLIKSLDSVHVPQNLMAHLEESQRLTLTSTGAQ